MLFFELFPLFMVAVSAAAFIGLFLMDRQARAEAQHAEPPPRPSDDRPGTSRT